MVSSEVSGDALVAAVSCDSFETRAHVSREHGVGLLQSETTSPFRQAHEQLAASDDAGPALRNSSNTTRNTLCALSTPLPSTSHYSSLYRVSPSDHVIPFRSSL